MVSRRMDADAPTLDSQTQVLHDIAHAENKQWRNRMIAAGVAAGTAYAIMQSVIGALFGS